MRVDIFGDNKGSKVIADSLRSTSRSKDIDVELHSIRGFIGTGEVRVLHVGMKELADVLTKSPGRNIFLVHRAALINVLGEFSAFV